METSDCLVMDKILECAKQEFLKKGFSRASMNNISVKAGDASGTLYGKFTDKDELFRIIVKESADRLYNYYEKIIDEFVSYPYIIPTNEINSYIDEQIDKIIDILYDNFDNYKLIFYRSRGSEYENYIEKLYELGSKNVIGYCNDSKKAGEKDMEAYARLAYVTFLSSGIIMSIEEVIKHEYSKDKAREYIEKYRRLSCGMAIELNSGLSNLFKK